MVQNKSRLTVADCPTEVLEHVFTFLPLSDRKSASLVCQAWCELVFAKRNMRHVQLKLCGSSLAEKYPVFLHSSRSYRNVFYDADFTRAEYELLLRVFDIIGPTVESFDCWTSFKTGKLREIVRRTPNIKKLHVGVLPDSASDGEPFPVLRHLTKIESTNNSFQLFGSHIHAMAPNVAELSIIFERTSKSPQVLQQFAPQLKSLELYSTNHFFPIDEVHLPQLKVLSLQGSTWNTSETAQRRFLGRLTGLQKMFFSGVIRESVLNSLPVACPGLHTLHISVESLGESSLAFLEHLKQLKILSLERAVLPTMLVGCKPASSVEQFELELHDGVDDKTICARLSKMLPNLQKMTVFLEERTELRGGLRHVFQNFTQLKHLAISNDDYMDSEWFTDFEAIDQLVKLEELELRSLQVPVEYLAPLNTLKRLKLKLFPYLDTNELLLIPRKFPELRYLEIVGCAKITLQDIQELRACFPSCVVYFEKSDI